MCGGFNSRSRALLFARGRLLGGYYETAPSLGGCAVRCLQLCRLFAGRSVSRRRWGWRRQPSRRRGWRKQSRWRIQRRRQVQRRHERSLFWRNEHEPRGQWHAERGLERSFHPQRKSGGNSLDAQSWKFALYAQSRQLARGTQPGKQRASHSEHQQRSSQGAKQPGGAQSQLESRSGDLPITSWQWHNWFAKRAVFGAAEPGFGNPAEHRRVCPGP